MSWDMSDEKPRQAIVPIETRMPSVAVPSGNRLVQRAVADIASSIRSRSTSPQLVMRRVGECEFLEDDYHQLVVWAELLGFDGDVDTVAAHLADAYRIYGHRHETIDDWVLNGQIQFAAFTRSGLSELPLRHVPSLKFLWCHSNKLAELDLSHVRELEFLHCDDNKLRELDLSRNPKLTDLRLQGNELTELNVSQVPELKGLNFASNHLTEIDLSEMAHLDWFRCHSNQLVEIDLSHVSELKVLEADLKVIE